METFSMVVGRYPHSESLRSGAVSPEGVALELIDIEPVNHAFDAMVEELRYDVCEIAVGAFLQAVAAGRPLRLLPAVTLARPQHGSIYVAPARVADGSISSPRDLAGHRIAVRAYSQTTGLWVRGILAEEYGVDLDAITWVTTEASHLAGFEDPPNTERAEAGSVLELLRSGAVDGAIHAPGLPSSDWCRPLIDDIDATARRFSAGLGAVPINHLLCVGPRLLADPPALRSIYAAIVASYRASGVLDRPESATYLDAVTIGRVVDRARTMAVAQGLLPADAAIEDCFAPGLGQEA